MIVWIWTEMHTESESYHFLIQIKKPARHEKVSVKTFLFSQQMLTKMCIFSAFSILQVMCIRVVWSGLMWSGWHGSQRTVAHVKVEGNDCSLHPRCSCRQYSVQRDQMHGSHLKHQSIFAPGAMVLLALPYLHINASLAHKQDLLWKLLMKWKLCRFVLRSLKCTI